MMRSNNEFWVVYAGAVVQRHAAQSKAEEGLSDLSGAMAAMGKDPSGLRCLPSSEAKSEGYELSEFTVDCRRD